jgi:hypothetical protein
VRGSGASESAPGVSRSSRSLATCSALTVPKRLKEKLEAARDALSHSHPGATEEEVLEAGLDLLLERAARERLGHPLFPARSPAAVRVRTSTRSQPRGRTAAM